MASGTPKVLVVDDYYRLQVFAKDILEPEFFVDTVGGYGEALTKLHDQTPPYDVAILDIRLNDKDELDEKGLELLEEIRKLGGYTQGIIWTGYETYRTMRKALKSLDAFDYLLKKSPDGLDTLDLTLPAAVKRAAERAYRLKDYPSLPQPRKILVVEKQPEWLSKITEALSGKGYEIMTASDCDRASKMLESEYVRLVVVGVGTPEGLTMDDAVDFIADIRERSKESDIVLLSPFSPGVAQVTHTITQYGVLDVFPKQDPFDEEGFGELIVHSISPFTQKYLTAQLVATSVDQPLIVGKKYTLQVQCLSKLPGSSVQYASFAMSPAQSPLDLLVRFNPFDMEVHSASEQNIQVNFEQDVQSATYEFTILRSGKKELAVDFYAQPQLRWLRRISLPIEARSG